MAPTRHISFFLALSLLISACSPLTRIHEQPTYGSMRWAYADLRLLDPPDAPRPTRDVIAAYLRFISPRDGLSSLLDLLNRAPEKEIQLRLDFLDLTYQNDCDIYLAIDYAPGGSSLAPWGGETQIDWDTLVLLTAAGQIQAFDTQLNATRGLSIRAVRNPVLDTLEITLDSKAFNGVTQGIHIQIVTVAPAGGAIADTIGPFDSNSPPPPPAPLLFAFWNSLPATTPALALRRWDGAHTGPLGGRHGLSNLLRAARNYRIPLTLLDLKSPISLSALDYVDGLPLVRKMALDGLLTLPETIPDVSSLYELSPPNTIPADYFSSALGFSRQASLAFDLPPSQFIYSPLDFGLPYDGRVVFARTQPQGNEKLKIQGATSLLRWREKVVIPIPEDLLSEQATLSGLSMDARRELLRTALANDSGSTSLLILGGDLPFSEWGVPQIARTGFDYLSAHPWIRVLGSNDLLGMLPASSFAVPEALASKRVPASLTSNSPVSRQFVDQLSKWSSSPLSQVAWQTLFSLYAPQSPDPPQLLALRANYLGQLGVLLAAARWSSAPVAGFTCLVDLDQDGLPECLLTSETVFAAFGSDSGVLTHLLIKTPSGVHQVIAPSSQFVVGLSDPASWELDRGLDADPSVLPGAFTDKSGPYTPDLKNNELIFSGDGIVKTYFLTPSGIHVDYRSEHPLSTKVPLALDEWVRFTPGWGERYSGDLAACGFIWQLSLGPSVQVCTDAGISSNLYNVTRKIMSSPEDPNVEFPPGHFLPFPLAVLTLDATGDFSVEISLSD